MATLIYDIIAGKNLLTPALQKVADKSQQLTNKLKGVSKVGQDNFNKWGSSANTFSGKLGNISQRFKGSLNTMSADFRKVSIPIWYD